MLNTHAMKIFEIYNTDENIGPAPASACSRPAKDLPASWISSCKSQGKRKRTGNRIEKVGGKSMKVSGKRIKGKRAHWKGNKRLASNPFEGFGRYDEKADCRRKRRALSESEINRLLAAAAERPLNDARTIRTGPKKGQMTATVNPDRIPLLKRQGEERVLIYKTLILTGLRKNELASITLKQCRLDGDLPYIDLHASDEKNGQGNNIPIPSDLAEELMDWIADRYKQSADMFNLGIKPSPIEDEPLFDVPTGLVRILNRDLVAAGIPKFDKYGLRLNLKQRLPI